MRKLLLAGLLVGFAASAFAQGQINLDKHINFNTSPTATSNGFFFFGNFGAVPVLLILILTFPSMAVLMLTAYYSSNI